jgi:hypothetical protein
MQLSVPVWMWVVVIVASGAVATAAWVGLALLLRPIGLTGRERGTTLGLAAALILGWLGVDITLASTHALRAGPHRFPFLGIAVALPLAAGFVLFALSPVLRRALSAIPGPWLIAVQGGRVLGGLFLVLLALNKLPARFALPAGIGDVLVGLAAPLVAYALATRRQGARPLALAFNVAGILDLAIAVTMGFTSAPGPQRVFFGGPSTALMALMPMTLIPIFLVPLAILVHAASLRALRAERATKSAPIPVGHSGSWRPPTPGTAPAKATRQQA